MNKVYLLLGSNIGDSMQHLKTAKKHLAKKLGSIKRVSSVYSTAAWGKRDQQDFLNQIIIIETQHEAVQALDIILAIEQEMGRIRTQKNAPRIIDIDILFFNKEIIKTASLVVPHPLLQDRKFVLVPLNELSPLWKHPVFKVSVHQLLLKCKDPLAVDKI